VVPGNVIPDAVLWTVLSVSFSLNVVFLRRLLSKVDEISKALFNPKDGAIIRIDRLERTMERRATPHHARGD
jgi:hypothetical protein